jgi:hypothetical protein
MKTTLAILVATLAVLLQPIAFAGPKPKTRTYEVPCTTAWEAAKTAVREHYDVLSLNDQTQAGSFTTGHHLVWSTPGCLLTQWNRRDLHSVGDGTLLRPDSQ